MVASCSWSMKMPAPGMRGLPSGREMRTSIAVPSEIEIANAGTEDFPQEQMDAVIALCKDILERHEIPAHRVLGHSDVSPGPQDRSGCKISLEGICRSRDRPLGRARKLLQVAASSRKAMRASQSRPCNPCSVSMATRLPSLVFLMSRQKQRFGAFQLHFRPGQVDGVADSSTITTLYKLSATLPEL